MLVFYQDFDNVYRIPLCKSNGNATLMPFTFQYLFSFYIYGCFWKTLQVQHTISVLPLSGKFLLTWIIIPGLSAVSTMEFDSSVSLPNLKHTKKRKSLLLTPQQAFARLQYHDSLAVSLEKHKIWVCCIVLFRFVEQLDGTFQLTVVSTTTWNQEIQALKLLLSLPIRSG